MKITRRDFLKISAITACSLVVSTGLSGCMDIYNPTDVAFNHGVASGDPLNNSVIIWTRLTPKDELDTLKLGYEVSKDKKFKKLIQSGSIITKKENDYTVKVDLQGLEAGTVYYYRFKSNEKVITGKTKTISTNPSQVKMAVFSCANYTNGYFNAYMEASKIEDLDVALQLGDYIYEYGMFDEDDGVTPAYATQNAEAIGRVLPSDNDTECITLEDYRKRYALYKTDEGALSIHANVPFIVVWDDHEIANDTYIDGAENHDESEGSFEDRKLAALQAFFEWLPIRPYVEGNNEIIYRNFEFGNLLSLYMLDTRVIGRDKQLSYASYYDSLGNFDAASFTADLTSSSRTLLGADQLGWIQMKIATSNSTWQVLGQQVLMGKMLLPAELLALIAQLEADLTDEQKYAVVMQLNATITELITLKFTDPTNPRLTTLLPYNLDAWDGYFYEREVVYGTAAAYGKNLVVLSGDTHNSWANNLKDLNGNNVGVEFAGTSVSSPGFEEYIGLPTMEASMQFEYAITTLVDDLLYANFNQRGFMEVTFTSNEVNTTWHYVANTDSTTYTMDTTRQMSLKTSAGTNTIETI